MMQDFHIAWKLDIYIDFRYIWLRHTVATAVREGRSFL